MLKAIIRTAVILILLAWLLPTVNFMNWTTLIIASIVLALLYGIVRPILKILFLPVNIVTLGLFSTLINVFLLWLATYLVPGFQIQPMTLAGLSLSHFWSLVVISLLIGFLNPLLKKVA